jgi:hypothetical protein
MEILNGTYYLYNISIMNAPPLHEPRLPVKYVERQTINVVFGGQ